ncbi:AAA family ATPase [Acuticoccus sediminis]|uniref:AAA family ATPase n=1 Tax=Acuticoccus sediminis TaxID=2184697 RepID=UPI001CFD561A|nr:MoxR family ATPase [Acuticoccus sediminis]
MTETSVQDPPPPLATVRGPAAALVEALTAGLVGHEALVERLVIALLVGGHVLIEGPPGVAKTRAVKRLADGVEGEFARIQCTPDLMPGDVIGIQVFRPERGVTEFMAGPVFHHLVLVDEINRAPPKVQSALLEAMAERQVTVGGVTRRLPDPFMVVATQNSIEHEGTFPLPEAQLDRFLCHVMVDLPGAATELAILDLVESEGGDRAGEVREHVSHEALTRMREAVAAVHLAPAVKDYIVRLVVATREEGTAGIAGRVGHAVSPRGTLALAASSRARAFLAGRDYVIPEDVAALAPDVLAHRLVPTWRATADGETSRGLIAAVLDAVRPL